MTGRSSRLPNLASGLPVFRRLLAGAGAALILLLSGTAGLQDANANGDTRTLDLYHEHTKESVSITYRQNGRYSTEGLRQLNWFLRDWRIDEQIQMDPKLFDVVWQVYREVRATGPIHVNSAYRSPQTNAALRRRSRAVAEFSQHMRGKAMDFFLEGVSMARVREIGVRLQQGGVGFYPHSRHQFVHLDAGGVRSWPRLPDAHLARLFPDGRTVHIPTSGQPLAGYEEAKSAILARGGTVGGITTYAEAGRRKSLWATLFGGEDEDEDLAATSPQGSTRLASAGTNDADGGVRGFFSLFGRSAAPAPSPAPVPEPEPPPPAAVERPAPTPVLPAIAAMPVSLPLPPRRPAELAAIARAEAVPKPASTVSLTPPSAIRPSTEGRGETRPPGKGQIAAIRTGDRQALRSLFESAGPQQSKVRTSFSSKGADVPSTGSFNRAPPSRPSPKR